MAGPDAWLLAFRSAAVARSAAPGQFLLVRPPDCSRAMLRRPISISDVSGDRVELLFRVAGAGTRSLAGLTPGRVIDIIGPLGSPFDIVPGPVRHIAVAGGIGIAPLRFLLRRIRARRLPVTLCYGCRTKRELVPHCAVDRIVATDNGSCGIRGLVTTALSRAVDSHPGAAVYACGPWPMLRETARICAERGLSCQVSLESRMACGVGACQGCAVKGTGSYLTVCKDGPVFDARTVDWDQEPPT